MRLRFRTAQIIALVAVLLITVTVVGYSSCQNATFALRDLSRQVLDQTSQRIDQHVTGILDVAVAQSTAYEELLASGALDPDAPMAMLQSFLARIRANPQLSYLSFANENGEYWHVFRAPDDTISAQTILVADDGSGTRVLTDYEPHPDGELVPVFTDPATGRQDPRTRPYYVVGKRAGEQTWTETYLFLSAGGSLDIPGVTRATPILDGDGQLLGVLTADFDLDAMSRFLQDLKVGQRGFAFILELRDDGQRRVIAHPEPARLTRPVDESNPAAGREALDIREFGDPRVRAFATRLPADLRRMAPDALSQVEFEQDGTRFLGCYRRLSGHADLDWVICTVMPEDDVMGPVYANTRMTLVVVLFGILVAVLVALVLSSVIAGALRELAEESQSIGRFELDGKEPRASYLIEVGQLATALEEMKTGLRSFRKFVPADIVRNLVQTGQEARLGGQRRDISIYFSDIVGFTEIAERMNADRLVEFLGEYLGAMTDEILRSGGTVDKYIGDAIMAFWGAPNPTDRHPLVACRTALATQRRLTTLHASWRERGLPELRMRIGLNTGEAVVGNFGSDSRLDYTAIGDAVNLASRLEGLNRFYGTDILLSEATYDRVAADVVVRLVDRVSVKGRREGIRVYELLGLPDQAPDDALELSERYAEALEHYLARDWDRAEAAFHDLADAFDDGPSRRMWERVREYRESPPPADWVGVFRMEQK